MKVIILAGGRGSRLGEATDAIPKPMVEVGGLPIIEHIVNRYIKYGFRDFIVAGGYRADVLQRWADKYAVSYRNTSDPKVTVYDTGLNTQTGGRLQQVSERENIGEPFMVTYGDGIGNINIQKLIDFHASHAGLCTVTSVRPPARFGRIQAHDNGMVYDFTEKRQVDEGWINGGFFVCNKGVLDLIENADTAFEARPLQALCMMGELYTYQHHGFWQCVDTQRDVQALNDLWKAGVKW